MWDQPSQMDISFRLLGTRVIVQPFFWITLALIGWPYFEMGGAIPLLIWVFAGFVSILLHEFGHVLVGRAFGSDGTIVLRAFGGVAIGAGNFRSAWKRIAVTAAGPGIQLVLFAILWLLDRFATEQVERLPPYAGLFFDFLLTINLYWAILNLLPIYPLDGGQITCDFLEHFFKRKGRTAGHAISMVIAGALAIFFLTQTTSMIFGIFLFMYAAMNFQILQSLREGYTPPDDYPWNN